MKDYKLTQEQIKKCIDYTKSFDDCEADSLSEMISVALEELLLYRQMMEKYNTNSEKLEWLARLGDEGRLGIITPIDTSNQTLLQPQGSIDEIRKKYIPRPNPIRFSYESVEADIGRCFTEMSNLQRIAIEERKRKENILESCKNYIKRRYNDTIEF